jgi:hypothetical protein
MRKVALYKIKGMTRDSAESSFLSEFSYENMNLRLVATDDNTTYSLVNEKGNKLIELTVEGTPIGKCVLNNILTLFTTGDKDRIYKIIYANNTWLLELLYEGNINFDVKNPIETLGYYESEDIQKVYWTDGKNQPRVINIASTKKYKAADSFDFVRDISSDNYPTVTITKEIGPAGMFAPGIIQYSFTYYNQNGAETSIFYTSPQYYIAPATRGGSPESKVSNTFKIDFTNLDTKFEYVRVYSCQYTSINATPIVKKVTDLSISSESNGSISYTDTGTSGEIVDNTLLLYLGGEEITAETITQKDNTLFLGNIGLTRRTIHDVLYQDDVSSMDTWLQENVKTNPITFTYNLSNPKTITPHNLTGNTYPYDIQLGFNSREIKYFKYREYYRFGLQFLHKTGKWSEVVYLEDVENNLPIKDYTGSSDAVPDYTDDRAILYPVATYKLDHSAVYTFLRADYIKVRPVVVYPTINDRESLCQGVLCPTVFNVKDRYENAPFAQSSWFTRPNAPFSMSTDLTKKDNWGALNTDSSVGTVISKESKAGSIAVDNYADYEDMTNSGAVAEFRHWHPIPSNNSRNAEIQCIYYESEPSPLLDKDTTETNLNKYIEDNAENYFVDQSIVTLHSPDIEFDTDLQNIDLSKCKLRIVGVVPLTGFTSDINIETSSNTNVYYKYDSSDDAAGKSMYPPGFWKESQKVVNTSRLGYRTLLSGSYWQDELSNYVSRSGDLNKWKTPTGFMVYPWHRNGSLNNLRLNANTNKGEVNTTTKTAMLKLKQECTLRFSYKSLYFPKEAPTTSSNVTWEEAVADVQLFNSDEVTRIELKNPIDGKDAISYYGNVDKVLNYHNVGSAATAGYPICVTGTVIHRIDKEQYQEDQKTGHALFSDNVYPLWDYTEYGRYDDAYKSTTTITVDLGTGTPTEVTINLKDGLLTNDYTGIDPVSIRYKSTPHAVIALMNDSTNGYENKQHILPKIVTKDYPNGINSTASMFLNKKPFWNMSTEWNDVQINQKVLGNTTSTDANLFPSVDNRYGDTGPSFGWLWLGELYREVNTDTIFGGKTKDALLNNQWYVSGDEIPLVDSISISDSEVDPDGDATKDDITIVWSEGDTYYQRYDHIKTYPFSKEDQNQVTDIVSFMVETKINLDGRYDRNRGKASLVVTPENFNIMNDVYNQNDTYFTYRTLDYDRFSIDKFTSQITWTKTKTPGELVDTWTNITVSSTLDLDGDKGPITALTKFNDSVIAFQDKGLAQILYNENTQISTTEGVPIEIANSGKVQGKRYLTEGVGCQNKWSICNTPAAIYFVDGYTASIYAFNGKLDKLSHRLGFHSWLVNKDSLMNKWYPGNNAFRTSYDNINSDVYFTDNNESLCYSEALGQFSSFYGYEGSSFMFNLEDKFLSIKDSNIWLQHEGDYNSFYGNYKDYYITLLSNPDSTNDKTFDNIEFRADTYKDNEVSHFETFNTIRAKNEYQDTGEVDLSFIKSGYPSNLKKKFRIWRANIPRDSKNKRDRIRNPWIYLTLKYKHNSTKSTEKTILHDLLVYYFVH